MNDAGIQDRVAVSPYLIGNKAPNKGRVCRDGVTLGRVSGRYRGESTTNGGRTGKFWTASVGEFERTTYGNVREGPTLSTRCETRWQATRLLIDFHRSYPHSRIMREFEPAARARYRRYQWPLGGQQALDAIDRYAVVLAVEAYRAQHGLTANGKRHTISV